VNGSSFIKEIGRSYIVSSFLPAALFVSLGVFIFRGFVPELILDGIQKTNSLLGFNKQDSLSIGGWFILFVATSWIAFYLYSSINWTVQLYEGYKFPGFVSEIMKFILRQLWHRKQIEIYEAIRGEFEKPVTIWNDDLKIPRQIALDEIQDLEGYGPIDMDDLLPTRLGNVLRASERYANERYKLNSLVVFPKLIHVFPAHFSNELEDKNNRFIFLVHSSFLAYVVGLTALVAVLVNKIFTPLCKFTFTPKFIIQSFCEGGFISRGFSVLSPDEYAIVGLFFVIVGYILYRIGVVAAREFALHIRAGFDLYRFDLLRQLNHQLPATLDDEKQIWGLLSEYFVAGNRLRFVDLSVQYQYYEKPASSQSKE
jgi:hypothetical protein